MAHELWIDKNDGKGFHQQLIEPGYPFAIIELLQQCVTNGWHCEYIPVRPEPQGYSDKEEDRP